ncbi:MAG: hypothetical protein HY606_15275 [Planctomycetes bacterium]|nr:hypothetical protein [Planctomycetota bacterium]
MGKIITIVSVLVCIMGVLIFSKTAKNNLDEKFSAIEKLLTEKDKTISDLKEANQKLVSELSKAKSVSATTAVNDDTTAENKTVSNTVQEKEQSKPSANSVKTARENLAQLLSQKFPGLDGKNKAISDMLDFGWDSYIVGLKKIGAIYEKYDEQTADQKAMEAVVDMIPQFVKLGLSLQSLRLPSESYGAFLLLSKISADPSLDQYKDDVLKYFDMVYSDQYDTLQDQFISAANASSVIFNQFKQTPFYHDLLVIEESNKGALDWFKKSLASHSDITHDVKTKLKNSLNLSNDQLKSVQGYVNNFSEEILKVKNKLGFFQAQKQLIINLRSSGVLASDQYKKTKQISSMFSSNHLQLQ